jgi:hypothetical protein
MGRAIQPRENKMNRINIQIETDDGAVNFSGPLQATKNFTEFTLTGFGEKKIQIIKVVREFTGLGLKQSKDLVESLPHAFVANDLAFEGVGSEVTIARFHGALIEHGAEASSPESGGAASLVLDFLGLVTNLVKL